MADLHQVIELMRLPPIRTNPTLDSSPVRSPVAASTFLLRWRLHGPGRRASQASGPVSSGGSLMNTLQTATRVRSEEEQP